MNFNKKEFSSLLRLALPVYLAQIATTSMGFVDTVVAGRASPIDMAAVAIASSFWMPTMLFTQGILMPITALIGQFIGAKKETEVNKTLWQGVYLALFLSAPVMIILYIISTLIPYINMDPALATLAVGYIRVVLFGVPGLLLYSVFRSYMEGHGRTRPSMVVGILGLLFNIPGNIIFVFGLFGFKAYGAVGCAIATAMVCWFMGIAMILYVLKAFPSTKKRVAISPLAMLRIARIGFPGALALLCETSLFATISILIAHLGTDIVAGHQIALNFSGLIFMMPLSLGIASTIRVSHHLGGGNLEMARTVRKYAISLASVLSLIMALGTIVFREQIASIYTSDPTVIQLASTLLILNAIFQFPDSVQMVSSSVLRAYNDTFAIFLCTMLAYWGIGLPLGYTLALTSQLTATPMGVQGFWIAIIIGLVIVSTLFFIRLKKLETMPLELVQKKITR